MADHHDVAAKLATPAAAAIGVSLRVMGDSGADLDFAARVYRSTRLEELSITGWPPAQIDAFIAQQHAAQHHHYSTYYPDLARYTIVVHGEDAGRLYLYAGTRDLRIVDIALLPPARGQGIGGALLADVTAAAAQAGLTASIHVERENPARRLYTRAGFVVIGTANEFYDLMAWHPPGMPAPASPVPADQKNTAS